MKAKKFIGIGIILCMMFFFGCATAPKNSGLNLHNIDVHQTGAEQDFTVVSVQTNPAANLAEPYPSMIAYVWQPADEPKIMINKMADIKAVREQIKTAGEEEKVALKKKYNRLCQDYREMYYDWLDDIKPKAVLSPENGKYFKAVGIDFKDASGNIVEVTDRKSKLLIDRQNVRNFEPWYGGEKKVLINKSLQELIDGGWRIAIMTNDDSPAKMVYGLDGRGLNGEEWGTPYFSFNIQAHGVKFEKNNPRIKALAAGSSEAEEALKWFQDLTYRAQLVAFRNDLVEQGLDGDLEEFKNITLDPFDKRWLERRTSRLEAVRRVMGEWSIVPVIGFSPSDMIVGIGLMKMINLSVALFGDKQFYLYGSAGSPVTRYDFAVSKLETEKQSKIYEKSPAINALIKRYNDLIVEYNNTTEEERQTELQDKINTISQQISSLPKK